MTRSQQILSGVHLRRGEALWVLAAHSYAVLVPLIVCFAVVDNWTFVSSTTDNPFLFFAAACLLAAGGAFEVAQNTIDNWYLTEETASAKGAGLCDFLFYWFVTAGQALIAVAIAGDNPWVVAIAAVGVLAVPPLYFTSGAYFAALGVVTLLTMVVAADAFGDPVVFLQFLMVGATLYFFEALMRTGAQVLHGFTAIAASSGVWFLVWAISNGASGLSSSWGSLVVASVVVVAVGLALWPRLMRLPSSKQVTMLATS